MVYGIIIVSFLSYIEKSVMNSLSRYSDRNEVVFKNFKSNTLVVMDAQVPLN